MKPYLLIIASLMIVHAIAAEPAFPTRDWKGGTPGLTVQKGASYDETAGTFEVRAPEQAVVPVMVDAQPGVGMHSYALLGEVKYEGVGGTGFLETWTSLGGNKAFSRTLGEYGPMSKLTGNSAWREFMLPMNLTGASAPVTQIEMNVVLPDGGKVWLRKLRLEPMTNGTPSSNLTAVMVGTGGLVLALVVALLILRKRRQSSEQEIKRMMAADV
ncbi:hypothetical protein [Prosthecobacter sp.]|uniref:hypothetical protein n=1 Tax=Prosthecobacter sp. TaxID=1965333 RepID=UPI00378368FA